MTLDVADQGDIGMTVIRQPVRPAGRGSGANGSDGPPLAYREECAV